MYKEELNEVKANLTAVSQELEVARKQLEEVISGLIWVYTIPQ